MARNIIQLIPSAARTTSGSKISEFCQLTDEMLIYVDVTANSGTGQTLKIDYQVSPDGGTTWTDHRSITDEADAHFNFTDGAGQNVLKVVSLLGNTGTLCRLNFVIAGTTPSYTFSVYLEGKRDGGDRLRQ